MKMKKKRLKLPHQRKKTFFFDKNNKNQITNIKKNKQTRKSFWVGKKKFKRVLQTKYETMVMLNMKKQKCNVLTLWWHMWHCTKILFIFE
jgi:hypothetical protein